LFIFRRNVQCSLGSAHTALEKSENAALFLLLGLPSTLIRHENGALFLLLGLPSTLIRHENGAYKNAISVTSFPQTLMQSDH